MQQIQEVAVVQVGNDKRLDEHLDCLYSEEGVNPPNVVQIR